MASKAQSREWGNPERDTPAPTCKEASLRGLSTHSLQAPLAWNKWVFSALLPREVLLLPPSKAARSSQVGKWDTKAVEGMWCSPPQESSGGVMMAGRAAASTGVAVDRGSKWGRLASPGR